MSQEEEEKAIEWLKKEITRNKIHIQDCKEAVKTKFYYDLDDEISFTQKDLDAETILLNLINDQQTELEKYKAIELKTKGGGIKVTLEGIVNLQQELEKKDKEINRLKDELGYTRKII